MGKRDTPGIAAVLLAAALAAAGIAFAGENYPVYRGGLEEVDAARRELVHRPRYSTAAFNRGELTSYELRNGGRGISADAAVQPR